MKPFNVYRHPAQGFEAVKVGFSWPAFFFGILWMLVCKLWALAGLWFALYVGMALIEAVTDEAKSIGLQALVYLMLIAGNKKQRGRTPLKRGWGQRMMDDGVRS